MWLEDVLPDSFGKKDYCGEEYWKWEELVKQFLLNSGYKVGDFYTIERDSFGPLVRGVKVITPQKEKKTLAYG